MKGKKTPNKPLKILEEDDEDLSALKDPSEKVSRTLPSYQRQLTSSEPHPSLLGALSHPQ